MADEQEQPKQFKGIPPAARKAKVPSRNLSEEARRAKESAGFRKAWERNRKAREEGR